MSEANKTQVAGDHYKAPGHEELWDRINRLRLDYFQGNIIKYVERCWKKNGLIDLRKASHYLQKYIELIEASKAGLFAVSDEERLKAEEFFGVDKANPDTEKTVFVTGLQISDDIPEIAPLTCEHAATSSLIFRNGVWRCRRCFEIELEALLETSPSTGPHYYYNGRCTRCDKDYAMAYPGEACPEFQGPAPLELRDKRGIKDLIATAKCPPHEWGFAAGITYCKKCGNPQKALQQTCAHEWSDAGGAVRCDHCGALSPDGKPMFQMREGRWRTACGFTAYVFRRLTPVGFWEGYCCAPGQPSLDTSWNELGMNSCPELSLAEFLSPLM